MGRNSETGIRRSLFGYRRSAVHELLLECDYTQRRAESNILAAEAKIADLQSELGEMEREIAGRDEQLAALQAEVARLEDRSTDGGPLFVTDEVASILTAAHDAAARIVERARSVSERMYETSRREEGVRADATRLAAWREAAVPVIRSARASMDGIRADLEHVAQRITDALTPLEGLAAIDDAVIALEEPTIVDELDESGDKLDGVRLIEPRPDRRGRTKSKDGRSSRSTRSVEGLTG
jgi:cell division septum initiation protein DivIVA